VRLTFACKSREQRICDLSMDVLREVLARPQLPHGAAYLVTLPDQAA
jgi:hypothetical protein